MEILLAPGAPEPRLDAGDRELPTVDDERDQAPDQLLRLNANRTWPRRSHVPDDNLYRLRLGELLLLPGMLAPGGRLRAIGRPLFSQQRGSPGRLGGVETAAALVPGRDPPFMPS